MFGNKKSEGAIARERVREELAEVEGYLYKTAWGKYFARPSQIRAAAKKLRDRLNGDARKITRQLMLPRAA